MNRPRIPLNDIIQETNNFADENIIKKKYDCTLYKGELFGKKLAFVLANKGYTLHNRLSSLPEHQNIVPFIGCCAEDGKKILVLEHPTRGDLDKYVSGAHLTWLMRVKICLDIACGLHYLQSHSETLNMIDMEDLNCVSICLDENWREKIRLLKCSLDTDGLPHRRIIIKKIVDDIVRGCKLGVQTGWPSKKYSFGVILFELLCARRAVRYDDDEEGAVNNNLV